MYNQLEINNLDSLLEKIKGFDYQKAIELLDIQFEFFLDSIDNRRVNASAMSVYDLKKQSDEIITKLQNNESLQDNILYFIDSGVNYSDLLKSKFEGFLIYVQKYEFGANYVYDAYVLNNTLMDFFLTMELEGKKNAQKKQHRNC